MSLQQGNVYGVLPRTSARSISIVLMLLHQIVSSPAPVVVALHLCFLLMCCLALFAACSSDVACPSGSICTTDAGAAVKAYGAVAGGFLFVLYPTLLHVRPVWLCTTAGCL